MTPTIQALLAQLQAAAHFEESSRALLRLLLDRAEAALADSRFRRGGRILRAMLHLRPEGGYRGLVVEDRSGAPPGAATEGALVPSATAWRWVSSLAAPLEIDVHKGALRPVGGEAISLWRSPRDAQPTAGSQQRLLHRSATHLLVLPLRAARGAIVGMVSIEAHSLAGIGAPFLWGELAEPAQLLVDLAAPWLLSAPPTPAPGAAPAPDPLLPVVGAAMRGLVGLLQVFAQQDETLLISGPTGSGKSRLARWCHARSGRAGQFVALELQSVPEDMQAPTLFGWRRGAFTGAVRDQEGLVRQAEGGTLFIDEIDKLSRRTQAALLQLLEEGAYRVLGGDGRLIQAGVRFLVGTNADLPALVREGGFREDLYYRINVLPVHLPPLDERGDEIPAWAAFMLARRHAGSPGEARLSAEAALALSGRRWPGNLRQLDNVLRRAYTIALAEGALAGGLEISARHVQRALGFEAMGAPASVVGSTEDLLAALEAAAQAYAAAAVRAKAGGETLPLERLEAMAGLALAAAQALTGDRESAFRAFGRDRMVDGRNHHKIWRREAARARALYAALGRPPPPELAD